MPLLQFQISNRVMEAISRAAKRQKVEPHELVRDMLFDRFLQLVEMNRLPTDIDPIREAEQTARTAYHNSIRPTVTVTL